MNNKIIAGLTFGLVAISAPTLAQNEGPVLYQQRCAICHESPEDYTPPKSTFAFRSAQFVVDTLTKGAMQPQAQGLSSKQIVAVAEFVTGKSINASGDSLQDSWDINYCHDKPSPLSANDLADTKNQWNGWGRDLTASRFQAQPGFAAKDIANLKVKWAFAYPSGRVNSQPVIVGGRVFVASNPGLIFSLDANTGCTYWTAEIANGARAAITIGPILNTQPAQYAAYISTRDRKVFALHADTGKVLWQQEVEEHPRAVLTGSPLLVGEKLIVPVSSMEEAAGRNEQYECCTFRGSVLALDIKDGKIVWKTHTIKEAPKPYRISEKGTQLYGPAGAAIWSSASYDEQRQWLYIATGDSYTDIVEKGSDAVMALDINTGKIIWQHQVTEQDNYLIGCMNNIRSHANCPEVMGPDYDFGSTPIIYNFVNDQNKPQTFLLVGQKSGIIYAMDPDQQGKIIWQQQPGVGSVRGGIQWGSAIDGNNVYTAVSDSIAPPDNRRPGISAYDLKTGELRWHTPAPKGICEQRGDRMTCTDAFSAAVTAMPGAVFASALNGWFGAFSTIDGKILWQQDMNQLEAKSLNGLTVHGGAMDATGPVIVNGIMYVNSGYGGTPGQPGNALFAFSIDGK